LIDHEGRIRNTNMEWDPTPGGRSDASVYSTSDLAVWIQARSQDVAGIRDIAGVEMSYWVAGDGGYCLRPGLFIPYTKQPGADQLPEAHRDFNFWFSSTRMLVEEVFGVLKGRWRILTSFHHLPYQPKEVHQIFTCCAILHNLNIHWGDGPVWRRDVSDANPTIPPLPGPAYVGDNNWQNSLQLAKEQRDALSVYLQEVHEEVHVGDDVAKAFG